MLRTASAIHFLLTLSIGAALIVGAPAYAESSQTGSTEVRVAELPVKLKRIRYSAPDYPSKAIQAQLSGFVTIEFVINTKGEPTELRIVDASPAEVFDRVVLEAAKRWRYSPLVVDKLPTRAIVRFKAQT